MSDSVAARGRARTHAWIGKDRNTDVLAGFLGYDEMRSPVSSMPRTHPSTRTGEAIEKGGQPPKPSQGLSTAPNRPRDMTQKGHLRVV